MKANEFVKKFGWCVARDVLSKAPLCAHKFDVVDGKVIYLQKVEDSLYWYNQPRKQYDHFSMDCEKYLLADLKRLVESLELVEVYGGLEDAKKELQRQSILRWINPETEGLRVAIADVESLLFPSLFPPLLPNAPSVSITVKSSID